MTTTNESRTASVYFDDEIESIKRDNRHLRRLLALAYSGFGNLYGDDDQLTDTSRMPYIDYVNDTVDKIEQSFHQRAYDAMEATDAKPQ